VKPAQVLASLDKRYFEDELRLACARRDNQKAVLEQLEHGSRPEDIEAARDRLRTEEVSVSQAERRRADSEILAPGAGKILTRARERGGDRRARRDGIHPDLDLPRLGPDLCQRGRPRTRRSLHARLRLADSAPGKVYRGHVGFVSPTAESNPRSVETRAPRTEPVYRLRIVVDNSDGGLRQGMPVTVRADRRRPAEVLGGH